MNPSSNTTDRIEAVHQEVIATLDGLIKQAAAFDLPAPSATLQDYRGKLADNSYQALVVGEAKRGKSSFVNALIGRSMLPTDVDIATSQVFHVRHAEREAYRLRFEDESQTPITAADLPRYGSQMVADDIGAPDLGPTIRWIEVEVPIRFLPSGVALLDTPGLGSLYAAHAQITQRFVPHADAVIFVLDSNRPIIDTELNFVETILGATCNIFFIQTKIDKHREEHWQQIRARNEAILAERFQGRLASMHVWPISSANLIQAAQTGDPDYLEVSGHKELAAALQAFLFRVAGWSRAAEAIVVAEHYHTLAAKTLSDRLAGLAGGAEARSVERCAVERRRRFEDDWDMQGAKRRELVASIRRVAAAGKHSFVAALQPSGPIEADRRKTIESLSSVAAAQQLGETIAGEVVATTLDAWRRACDETQASCAALIAPFLEAVDEMRFPPAADQPDLDIRAGSPLAIKDDLWNKVKSAQSGFLHASEAAVSGVSLLAYVLGTSAVLPMLPVATLGIVVVGIWGMARAWKFAELERVEEAQQALHDRLSQILHEVRQHFFDPKLSCDGMSLVEKQFDSLVETMSEHIQRVAVQNSTEAGQEIARLEGMTSLGDQQRGPVATRIRQQLSEWDAIGRSLHSIAEGLKELDRSLLTDAAR